MISKDILNSIRNSLFARQEVFMSKLFMPILCNSEKNSKGIRRSVLPYVLAALLLFSVMSSPVQAADPDPRIAALQADVAALQAGGAAPGVTYATILQTAVAAGLSVDGAVDAMVTAGANAGNVVYLAIQANFSPTDVVNGAAEATVRMNLEPAALQAQTNLIYSTALQAGATESQINGGLSTGGIGAGIISNASVAAGKSPAPVFGYSAPTGPSGGAGGGGALGGGGLPGGGGGTIGGSGLSGTRTASDYKPR
jgi:hypothetical protein